MKHRKWLRENKNRQKEQFGIQPSQLTLATGGWTSKFAMEVFPKRKKIANFLFCVNFQLKQAETQRKTEGKLKGICDCRLFMQQIFLPCIIIKSAMKPTAGRNFHLALAFVCIALLNLSNAQLTPLSPVTQEILARP